MYANSIKGYTGSAEQREALKKINPTVTKMRERLAEGEEPPIQVWMTADRNGRAEVALSAMMAGIIITQDDGDVTPITFLAPATQNTMRNKKYVGHFSNSLAYAKPMYFDKKDIFGCVLSITSKAIAEANGAWYDDHDLRTPYDVTVIGVAETVNDEKEEEKEEAIGFRFPKLPDEFTDEGLNGDADIPVLVAIHKVMPFGYGDNPPSGNLKDEAIKMSFQELHEYGLMHAQAAEYLLKEHGGTSLHKAEGFNLSMLTKEFRDKVKPLLEENIETTPRPMSDSSPDHQLMVKEIQAAFDMQVNEAIDKDPVLQGIFKNGQGGQHQADTQDGNNRSAGDAASIIKAFKDLDKEEGGSKDASYNSYAKAFYSILAMREVTDPEEGTKTLELCSELNPYFAEILTKSGKLQNAVKLNQQLLAFSTRLQESGQIQDHFIDMPPMNKACMTQMTVAGWLSQTLTSEYAQDKTRLTCFNLAASCAKTDAHWSALNNMNDNHMECELGVGEDSRTKIDTKALSSYDITTVAELCTLLANVNTFIKFIAARKDLGYSPNNQPMLSGWLDQLLSEITGRDGRKWLDEATKQTPFLPYAIALRVQNAFALLCRAAHDIQLNEAACAGTPPERNVRIIRDIRMSFEQVLTDLAMARISNTAGPFGGAPPLTLKEHCPTVFSTMFPHLVAAGERKRGRDRDNAGDAKGVRGGKTPNPNGKPNNGEGEAQGKDKGFLILIDATKRPNMSTYKPPRVTAGTRHRFLCVLFCTQGLACPYKGKCNFAHIFDAKRLPKAEQDGLKRYVNSEPAVKWAEGEEPRGVTFDRGPPQPAGAPAPAAPEAADENPEGGAPAGGPPNDNGRRGPP